MNRHVPGAQVCRYQNHCIILFLLLTLIVAQWFILSVTPLLLLLLLFADRAANECIVGIGVDIRAGVPTDNAVSTMVWGSQRLAIWLLLYHLYITNAVISFDFVVWWSPTHCWWCLVLLDVPGQSYPSAVQILLLCPFWRHSCHSPSGLPLPSWAFSSSIGISKKAGNLSMSSPYPLAHVIWCMAQRAICISWWLWPQFLRYLDQTWVLVQSRHMWYLSWFVWLVLRIHRSDPILFSSTLCCWFDLAWNNGHTGQWTIGNLLGTPFLGLQCGYWRMPSCIGFALGLGNGGSTMMTSYSDRHAISFDIAIQLITWLWLLCQYHILQYQWIHIRGLGIGM